MVCTSFVEVFSVMGKVVSEIEDKVAVENIDDNSLLDCKQAGEDELR